MSQFALIEKKAEGLAPPDPKVRAKRAAPKRAGIAKIDDNKPNECAEIGSLGDTGEDRKFVLNKLALWWQERRNLALGDCFNLSMIKSDCAFTFSIILNTHASMRAESDVLIAELNSLHVCGERLIEEGEDLIAEGHTIIANAKAYIIRKDSYDKVKDALKLKYSKFIAKRASYTDKIDVLNAKFDKSIYNSNRIISEIDSILKEMNDTYSIYAKNYRNGVDGAPPKGLMYH